jgi:hypothetical protein
MSGSSLQQDRQWLAPSISNISATLLKMAATSLLCTGMLRQHLLEARGVLNRVAGLVVVEVEENDGGPFRGATGPRDRGPGNCAMALA